MPGKCAGECMHSSTHTQPWHKMEVSGELHNPATLPPQKEAPPPTGKEAGWAPELVWMRWHKEKLPTFARIQLPVI